MIYGVITAEVTTISDARFLSSWCSLSCLSFGVALNASHAHYARASWCWMNRNLGVWDHQRLRILSIFLLNTCIISCSACNVVWLRVVNVFASIARSTYRKMLIVRLCFRIVVLMHANSSSRVCFINIIRVWCHQCTVSTFSSLKDRVMIIIIIVVEMLRKDDVQRMCLPYLLFATKES
jgi:hypothetical protein